MLRWPCTAVLVWRKVRRNAARRVIVWSQARGLGESATKLCALPLPWSGLS